MEDFQQRLLEEQKELSEKIGKLLDFVGTENFKALSPLKKNLLETQLCIMQSYSMVLFMRIMEENIEVG